MALPVPLRGLPGPGEPTRDEGSGGALSASLHWLHRLLGWQVDVTRHRYGALADDEYRGLYVPDREADLLGAPGWGEGALPPELRARRAALASERAAWDRAGEAGDAPNGELAPLKRLARLFRLSAFEEDVLLLGLAPEIDLRFERLYAYIQDDVTRKRPSVDLALRLLCPDPAARLEARRSFAPGSPLLRHHLIQVFEDGQRLPPLPGQFFKPDDRIVAEVLGQADTMLDPVIGPYCSLSRPARTMADLVVPPELRETLSRMVAQPALHERGPILALQGSYGSGRGAIADAIAAELAVPLLAVSLDRLAASDLDPRETLERVLREAVLRGAAIFWHQAERLLQDEAVTPVDGGGGSIRPASAGPWRGALLAALGNHPGWAFLALEGGWEARGALGAAGGRFLRVDVPPPSYGAREALWRNRLGADAPDEATLAALASTFRLSGGQIRDAVAMARSVAGARGEGPRAEDLYAACRAQSSGRLDLLAHKITPTYGWDDIVLPADHVGQLHEISAQVRHRRTVLDTWGFDAHLAMGKGLNALFAGPSGTGKTMAAEIVAADLGLELYKVDLSSLVSKFIGETEKNLDRIFTAAREANAILFFDEADAIFGKRSEVKDAHDRYANIEVGYLLQKMEEYDGVVVLATNLRKNLDDAFVRRIHTAIDFPFPEEPDRRRIWDKVFPASAPLDETVDLGFLAQRFKLAGGNIRNIALLSAFLAAEEGEAIGMGHLMRAIKREYQKMGKLLTESDFGPYFAQVRG